jgi:hypothetical protein
LTKKIERFQNVGDKKLGQWTNPNNINHCVSPQKKIIAVTANIKEYEITIFCFIRVSHPKKRARTVSEASAEGNIWM